MNTLVISGILTGVRAVLSWLTARQAGNRAGALDILRAVDLSPFGLDDDALELVNYARAGLAYLTQRGVIIDEAIALIELAESEGRDITPEEVQEHLDLAQTELDDTQAMIDALREEEQG